MQLNEFAAKIYQNDSIELFRDELDEFEKVIRELHVNLSDALQDFYKESRESALDSLILCAINILYYFGQSRIDADAIYKKCCKLCINKNYDMDVPELIANIHYFISYSAYAYHAENGKSKDSTEFLCAGIHAIEKWFEHKGISFEKELSMRIEAINRYWIEEKKKAGCCE